MTYDPSRAPARAMYKATGLTDDDLARPKVAVVHTWTDASPCNLNLRRLAEQVKAGVRAAGGTPFEFNTVSVSDGICMGTDGMRTSLVSREVIADSLELAVYAHGFDAVVALCGCDKTIPGTAMAVTRLDLPAVILYGGSIHPGRFQGRDVTVQDVFEAVGAHAAGTMTTEELRALEDAASWRRRLRPPVHREHHVVRAHRPGSPPRGSTTCRRWTSGNVRHGRSVVRHGTPPPGSASEFPAHAEAFENAVRVVAATGGSTNAVLHLLALAEAQVLDLATFDRWCAETPTFCDLKPGGRYTAVDLEQAGGMRLVLKRLADAELKDSPTVSDGASSTRPQRQRNRPARMWSCPSISPSSPTEGWPCSSAASLQRGAS